jgi:phage baseplate assembly protein W
VLQVVLESEVRNYLGVYEPRVHITSATITFSANNQMDCEVSGEIVNIQEPFTVTVLVDRLR